MKLKPILEMNPAYHRAMLKLQQDAIELDADAEFNDEKALIIKPSDRVFMILHQALEANHEADGELDDFSDDPIVPADSIYLNITVSDGQLMMFGPEGHVRIGEDDIAEYVHNFCSGNASAL